MEGGKRNLAALDLLRVASALLVLAYHFGATFAHGGSLHSAPWPEIAALPQVWRDWSWFGWVGVEIFFVISGVVIAGSAQGSDAAGFLARRARRLVPAAWLCATITAALLLAMGAAPGRIAGEWAGTMFFVPMGPWIDASYWTLGIECAFYLLVAGVIRMTGSAHLDRLAWLLALASLGYFAAVISVGVPRGETLRRLLELALLPHGALFALGIFARGVLAGKLTAMRGAGIALCLCLGLAEILGRAAGEAHALGIAGSLSAPLLLFAAAMAVLFAAPLLQVPIERWIGQATAARLGLATYPLYLLHQDAGGALFVVLQRAGLAPFAALTVTLSLVIAAALLIAAWLEPWLRAGLVRAASALSRFRPAPIVFGEHAER